ncbi:unnamed protein product [Acanthoscelides obtectus]|uniref:Uncharacterized protein n=1 Tax=Acanthoscelides obtectus TaxID=200917 RepID=A0A9P0JPP2_ACAOB|nr:unnamed protein product [Acanthoscelides obtectus]CAK1668058.1 hypothetical protein AOBTE_LOCUS26200 [Acanthoscelides obtectus]
MDGNDVDMAAEDMEYDEHNLSNIKDFTKRVVQRWSERFKKGCLTTVHFEELWRHWVPKIYSPTVNESCLNWNFNEELAQEVLFNTLDEFICNGDPSVVLKQLCEMDRAPSLS